jgi:hypothetical protein
MEYPELVKFRDGVSAIEQFFVEMAANENQLLTFGYKRAFELPTANPAFAALTTF